MTHLQKHSLAGKTVLLNDNVKFDPRGMIFPGVEFRVEDWVDVMGRSWMAQENWATLHYAKRQSESRSDLPYDDEVVYGKIGSMGHCVHNSELGGVL